METPEGEKADLLEQKMQQPGMTPQPTQEELEWYQIYKGGLEQAYAVELKLQGERAGTAEGPSNEEREWDVKFQDRVETKRTGEKRDQ